MRVIGRTRPHHTLAFLVPSFHLFVVKRPERRRGTANAENWALYLKRSKAVGEFSVLIHYYRLV